MKRWRRSSLARAAKPDRQGRHHQSGREVTSKNGGARSSLSSGPLRPPHITECLVSDETGTIVFTARNDQVDIMKPGTTVIPNNAKIDMFDQGDYEACS
ncbi:putative nucleic acid-binding protein [Rosa chinensis]|uniref:Putative nucleic acid-binding protein n=1 Tax=Rosa chinensis TaxID=74649 RepID=A0A2P6PJJ3_ROSCH|nr:putative nucleic acid-binding protein [Rosa chinensis]